MYTIWKDTHNVEDGLEVQTIRREAVNYFADWQEENIYPLFTPPLLPGLDEDSLSTYAKGRCTLKVRVYQELEFLFERLSALFETARQRFAICPDCGENRYTGKPCVKQ